MNTQSIVRHGAAGTALAAALAIALAASPGSSASAKAPAAHARRAAADTAPMPDNATPRLVTLSVGTGQMIVLPRAISDVFVANDKIADVQPRTATRLYVFAKTPGDTTVSATDKTGAVVFTATIRVGNNISSLAQMLKLTMAGSQITATPMNGMVVLTGTVAAPSDVEEATRLVQAYVGKDVMVVTRLQTSTPLQVMLRVRIAEVNREISKAIGVNFLSNDPGGSNNFGGGTSQGSSIGSLTSTTDATTGKITKSFVLNAINGTGTRFGVAGHLLGLDLLAAVDLAETDGYATTLAEPTLTAISGETASFLAGGEIPIPVPQYQGVTTIEYKQYGVSLAFTPTVLGTGRISLRVRPEVSQLTSSTVQINGYQIPGLTTRRAETTVELGSGQSFAIGGLLDNTGNNSVSKAPFLGDLPVIGALFRSNTFKKSETELVIIITPYLVKPVSDSQIALPTDGFRNTTDLGRLFLNKGVAGDDASKRVLPRADAPAVQPAPGAPVATLAAPGPRRKEDAPAAAPGFSSN